MQARERLSNLITKNIHSLLHDPSCHCGNAVTVRSLDLQSRGHGAARLCPPYETSLEIRAADVERDLEAELVRLQGMVEQSA